MNSIFSIPSRVLISLAMCLLLITACGGSNSSENLVPSDNGNTTPSPQPNIGENPSVTVQPEDDSSTTNPTDVEPENALSTTVNFNITVPAYSSSALQVGITWGDVTLAASWVGDEQWSVSSDLQSSSNNILQITFYDDNGRVTLGQLKQSYTTGNSDYEVLTVTANQFDTDSWDSDNDGISNLDELIAGTDAFESPRVLLFSETQEFRHDSIETALVALEELAASINMRTDRANDSSNIFTATNLANYDAVVWVMTSGDVLNTNEQTAFENYIRLGGGYVGIHAASFTEYEWPWYGNLVGAYFDRHPETQSARQFVEDNNHISTQHLNPVWTRTDEWYDYQTNPRALVNVLLTLDENSYSGGGMGADHPSVWYHDYDGGRSWYTGGGHTEESYSETDFRTHLLGGLRYAAGAP